MQPEFERGRQVDAVMANPAAQVRPQALRPGDVLENNMRATLKFLNAPRLDDMRVFFQVNPRLRLFGEARDGCFIVEQVPQKRLERDRLPFLVIVTQVNDAHAALKHLRDLIATVDPIPIAEIVAFFAARQIDNRG